MRTREETATPFKSEPEYLGCCPLRVLSLRPWLPLPLDQPGVPAPQHEQPVPTCLWRDRGHSRQPALVGCTDPASGRRAGTGTRAQGRGSGCAHPSPQFCSRRVSKRPTVHVSAGVLSCPRPISHPLWISLRKWT